jgi:hypothetical protein
MQNWNLPVQWADKFTVTTSFKTEIISSQNGTEQRRAKRGSPRRTFDFSLLAIKDFLSQFQFFMSTAQRNVVVMPEAVRYVRSTAVLAEGASLLSVASVAPWMEEGGFVALIMGTNVRVFQIAGINGNTLSFTEGADRTWRAGIKVAAAWRGLLSDNMSFDLVTNQALRGSVSFSAMPGYDKFVQTETNISRVFDGRELFPFKNNWTTAPTVTYQQDRKIVDYGRGVIEMTAPIPFGNRIYTNDVLCKTPEQVADLTEFFGRMYGRQGEFFFRPHAATPLVLAQSYAMDQPTLLLVGDEPRRTFSLDKTLRVIELRRRGGLPIYRVVQSVVASGGNSLVTLQYGFPEIISEDDDSVTISWVALARFETDDLVVDWATDMAATSRLTIRTLEYAVADADPNGLDDGAQWLLDYYGTGFAEQYILDPLLYVLNVAEPRFALSVD